MDFNYKFWGRNILYEGKGEESWGHKELHPI